MRQRWNGPYRFFLAAVVLTALAPLLIGWSGRWLAVGTQCSERADAMVVLAGAPEYHTRTRWAAELFDRGLAPTVLLTNDGLLGPWDPATQRNPLYVERAWEALVRAGVPAEQIIVLPSAVNGTRDEALVLREYVEHQPLRSLLIVTSPYHARRAKWIFRETLPASGPEVRACAVPLRLQGWWIPPADVRAILSEHVKGIGYRILY